MCITGMVRKISFYERDDIFTVSIHADPIRFYPFFWGHANELGKDKGAWFSI